MSVDSAGVELKKGDFVVCVMPNSHEIALGIVFNVTPKGATIDTEIEEAIIAFDMETTDRFGFARSNWHQTGIGSKRVVRLSKQIYKVD